jgi:hypothetical protein
LGDTIRAKGDCNATHRRVYGSARRIHRIRRGIAWSHTQGDTLDEARANLKEALQLVLEANRELAERSIVGRSVSKEPFDLVAQ